VHHLHSPGLKSDEQADAERVRAPAEVDGAQVDSFFVRPQVVHDDAVPARTPRFGDRGPGLFGGLERPVFISAPGRRRRCAPPTPIGST
jgi:hypothetical protein